jgi:hypothetical protein
MDRMKAIDVILLAFLALGAGSCARHIASSGAAPGNMSPVARLQGRSNGDNLLATGLIGWQQIGGSQGTWRFQDGILYTEGAGGGWLATLRQYDDFRLSLEFRVSPGGNSGVFLRAPLEGNPAYAGMEIQILDDYAEQWQGLNPDQYTGSIYAVQAPAERASRRAGQWQRMIITARGPQIQVVLNGQKILDTDVTYHRHKADTHPGLIRAGGYIGLQSHSSRVEFRNIRIQELP